MSPPLVADRLSLWYGDFRALVDVGLVAAPGEILALVGPSGCGKSTLLRCFNRMNDAPTTRISGRLEVLGHDAHGPELDVIRLRREVGMVFQRPNPLPMSIRDNVLFALRLHRGVPPRAEADAIVEDALRRVSLWERARDRLQRSAESLSLEERQKLCIARLLPVKPKVLLMDEPCSALDPKGTEAVEELLWDLRGEYTILIVTHNMAQARRASEECVFMLMGKVVEHSRTDVLFVTPAHKETADYIEGRYG